MREPAIGAVVWEAEQNRLRTIGVVLIVLGLVLNPWLLSHLRSSQKTGLGSLTLILLADTFLLSFGFVFLLVKQKIRLFRSVLVLASLAAWLSVSLVGAEIYFNVKRANDDVYQAFHVQYLHPFYFFSFPSDPAILKQINNAAVTVTPEGFRGDGPDKKSERKLAFLIGGSAAFGDGASSDKTTISAYLNATQSEYFFVNAGVPSWNSTQEFYRVAQQLLTYKPALIRNHEPTVQFYDFSNVFERHSNEAQLNRLFIDSVHLTDAGNKIIAEEMWLRISAKEIK